MIFVNLPVKDLNRSVEFFTKMGYTFNPQFTNEDATCMIVSESILVMLLVEPFFKNFTKKNIVNTSNDTEVIISLSVDGREHVDAMADKAIAAGAATPNDTLEMDGMYARSFEDPDGHHWEYMFMDPSAVNQEKEAVQASEV